MLASASQVLEWHEEFGGICDEECWLFNQLPLHSEICSALVEYYHFYSGLCNKPLPTFDLDQPCRIRVLCQEKPSLLVLECCCCCAELDVR